MTSGFTQDSLKVRSRFRRAGALGIGAVLGTVNTGSIPAPGTSTVVCPPTRPDNPGVQRDGDAIWPKRSEAEKRRMRARLLYDFEMECREQGWGDPVFVYDEEHDLFRFTDGRFAFSREHADWELLRKRGRMKGL